MIDGHMRWSLEFISRDKLSNSKLNFIAASSSDIVLHIAYNRDVGTLVVDRQIEGCWQTEHVTKLRNYDPGSLLSSSISVNIAAGKEGGVEINWRGGVFRVNWLSIDELLQCRTQDEGIVVWHRAPSWAATFLTGWRLQCHNSGYPAMNRTLTEKINGVGLRQGLSFIIRAKNEAHVVERGLSSIQGIADEIIFVDNRSSDHTSAIAARAQLQMFEMKTFSYPHDIPRAGIDHAEQVLQGSSNTLGHFYNWCLARSTSWNFIKWDADYIAIRSNLKEMVSDYNLRTRGDNFSLWFSGIEVYTDGARYWVDTNSVHSEFRVFSLRHGHHWVNLPPWEEIDQRSLFSAQNLFFTKPVYLELFRLDPVEFRDRGFFSDDRRDQERKIYIEMFQSTGQVPSFFVQIDGLDDPKLQGMPLSPRELEHARYFDRHFRSAPQISHRHSAFETSFDTLSQNDCCIFIISCHKNEAQQEAIRNTWVRDARQLGISYFFVIGRPGQQNCIVGDILYLDVYDTYEFLASKVLAAVNFSLERLNVEYIFKVDDDCVVDLYAFLQVDYSSSDFLGGGLAGGGASLIDWHSGKCRNEQLDDVAYFRSGDFFWIGGQFGYFLSRHARQIVVDHADAIRASLYEDYIVAFVLQQQGVSLQSPFGDFQSVKYIDDWRQASKVLVVSDIPSVAAMEVVYTDLVGLSRFSKETDRSASESKVLYDWMDFEAVQRKLIMGKSVIHPQAGVKPSDEQSGGELIDNVARDDFDSYSEPTSADQASDEAVQLPESLNTTRSIGDGVMVTDNSRKSQAELPTKRRNTRHKSKA